MPASLSTPLLEPAPVGIIPRGRRSGDHQCQWEAPLQVRVLQKGDTIQLEAHEAYWTARRTSSLQIKIVTDNSTRQPN